jgi:hypothetical protein
VSARRSELPPIRDIAEDLRDGADYTELCTRYNVAAGTLANRLAYAGYAVTGHPSRSEVRPSLAGGGEGNCITGNGGGDYTGLPTEAVLHASSRRRRVFVGLDWSTSPASGPMWVEL